MAYLNIIYNDELEDHGNLCIKDPLSNTSVVSTGKASIPHSLNVQIASARLLLCASRAYFWQFV